MTNIVSFSRALGDATRWRIVRLVLDEALCVCELADILEMPQSSVSSHVQVIRRAGLLVSEKCEKWTYSLGSDAVMKSSAFFMFFKIFRIEWFLML
jgi:ArsR family transcriptional regulator